jgi:hypothetical protein
MKIRFGVAAGIVLLIVTGVVSLGGVFALAAEGQERKATAAARQTVIATRPMAYVASRETVVQGTIVKYEETSKATPIGAHAQVQTAAGVIDVHLGPSSYLRNNHFSLASGDAVRITGAQTTTRHGSVLLARSVQRGSDTIVVRSARGFAVGAGGTRALAAKNGTQSLKRAVAR